MLNQMTPQEKIDIMTLDYRILWFRVWCQLPGDKPAKDIEWLDIYRNRQTIDVVYEQTAQHFAYFQKRKTRFENVFCRDGGKRLRGMLNKTTRCGRQLWELPKGKADKYESLVDSAKRELKEETGLTSHHYEVLLEMDLSNSVSDERAIVYLATGLVEVEASPEETEELHLRKMTLAEAYTLVEQRVIRDSLTVAAIYKMRILELEGKL